MRVKMASVDSPLVAALNNTYERALISMYKMPRIWMEYLEFLTEQNLVTRTRRTFDKALMSLPITQHDRIWILYLKFISQPDIPVETAVRIYRRYLKLEPSHAEEYITYLKSKSRWGEAAKRLIEIVNDEGFRSLEGKTKHDLWMELCEIITSHPDEMKSIKVEDIVRGGIRRYKDEVGKLWTALADYYIRKGIFEKARDIYEEGMNSVVTVRDFSLIYDALTQFEEAMISAKMEGMNDEDEEQSEGDGEGFLLRDKGNDLDLRLARLENMIERRPELLNSVILRQNPHNVNEWHKRAKLFAKDVSKQILAYTEALKTIDPKLVVGNPHSLWLAFAKIYERHKDLENARFVFTRASEYPFLYVDNLASIWSERIEMELRHNNFKTALELAREVTKPPSKRRNREEESDMKVQERVYRSSKLWALRLDLEESLSSADDVRDAYTAVMDLKVATVQMILNYSSYLKDEGYFEDSFKVYERGIALFKYPHVKDIWTAYLNDFIARYGGTKVERARELFQEACESAPKNAAKSFYIQFASFEEKFGLAGNAMGVYEKAVRMVQRSDRLQLYELYIARASEFYGITKVREIYEVAIEADAENALNDKDTVALCIQYSALERRLGEIDRARAILIHGSSLADPAKYQSFWKEWNEFEVKHGNEETFREMLRIKRSVAAAFSQQHFNTTVIDAASVAAAHKPGIEIGVKRRAVDISLLEEDITAGTRVPGFVSAGVIQKGPAAENGADAADKQQNPEDIDIEQDERPEDMELETNVPDAVFGGLRSNP